MGTYILCVNTPDPERRCAYCDTPAVCLLSQPSKLPFLVGRTRTIPFPRHTWLCHDHATKKAWLCDRETWGEGHLYEFTGGAMSAEKKQLIDLHPSWYSHGDHEQAGLCCDCPCGCEYRMAIPFRNPIGDGPLNEKGWMRTGEDFDSLTLTPSIQRLGPCPSLWHGWITNGEIITCE